MVNITGTPRSINRSATEKSFRRCRLTSRMATSAPTVSASLPFGYGRGGADDFYAALLKQNFEAKQKKACILGYQRSPFAHGGVFPISFRENSRGRHTRHPSMLYCHFGERSARKSAHGRNPAVASDSLGPSASRRLSQPVGVGRNRLPSSADARKSHRKQALAAQNEISGCVAEMFIKTLHFCHREYDNYSYPQISTGFYSVYVPEIIVATPFSLNPKRH